MTKVATLLSHTGRPIAIPRLAALSGLGARQFERQFRSTIGIAPKLYGRMLRFDRAMDLRLSAPGASWTAISQEAGYFDQSHMIRDFRAFSGDAPSEFLRQAEPAREERLEIARDVANVQSEALPSFL
jgi:transcriptional regulator GlxA family with amidase domain